MCRLFRWKGKALWLCLTVNYLVAGRHLHRRCYMLPTPTGSCGATNERSTSAGSNLEGMQMSPLLLEPRRLLLHLFWKLRKCCVCLFAGHRDASEGPAELLTQKRWRERSRDLLNPTRKTIPACLLGCNLVSLKYPASLSQELKKAPGWRLGDAALPTSGGGHWLTSHYWHLLQQAKSILEH